MGDDASLESDPNYYDYYNPMYLPMMSKRSNMGELRTQLSQAARLAKRRGRGKNRSKEDKMALKYYPLLFA